jgi:hypothetical protein
MTMTVNGLQAAILAEMEAAVGAPEDEDFASDFALAIAKAVVEYIQANAEVPVTVTGVQAGGDMAPGTGTVT